MSNQNAVNAWDKLPDNIRMALMSNTLASLKPEERLLLYTEVCRAKGLDPATRPFEFIALKGKLAMYARKECADQLRERNGVSVEIISQSIQGAAFVVQVRAKNTEGRTEDDMGATSIVEPEFREKADGSKYPNPRHGKPMEGTDIANAILKAVTKAKRRVTLSICGLGMFDESELEGIAESDKAKAPTLEEVQRIAAKVAELKERASKSPKKEQQELIREACALEATILDQSGSGHTPNEPAKAQEAAPAVSTPKAEEKPAGGTPPASTETRGVVITGQTGVTAEEKPLTPEPVQTPAAPAVQEPAPVQTPDPAAQEPPTAAAAPEPAAAGDWRNHTILTIPNRLFKGKKMGELEGMMSGDQKTPVLRMIYDNWVLKFAEEIAKVPDKIADAAAVTAAVKELKLVA